MEIYGINFEHKHKNQEKPARRGAEQYRDSHRRPGVVGTELRSDLGNCGIRKCWRGILETRHWREWDPVDQELAGVETQRTRKALKLSPRRRNPGKARSRWKLVVLGNNYVHVLTFMCTLLLHTSGADFILAYNL